MLKWCDKAYGIHYVALRYFNAAGSNQDVGIGEDHSPESHLIPLVMKTALGQRSHIGIFGDDYPTPDGTCVRDYIHVRDLAEAHLLALEHLEKTGESGIFNLGSGDGYSVKEIIDTARRITGKEIPAVVEPRRAGDPLRADCLQQEGCRSAGLDAQAGPGGDHLRRLGLALQPPQRLRGLRKQRGSHLKIKQQGPGGISAGALLCNWAAVGPVRIPRTATRPCGSTASGTRRETGRRP